MIQTITLIGAGRVGSALAIHLHACDIRVAQVYSRTPERARTVADRVGARAVHELEKLHATGDCFLLAVPDDAIAQTATRLASILPAQTLLAHTSGATPINAIPTHFRAGIFYPLQSFAKRREVDWNTLPLCVHATSERDLHLLEKLAARLAPNVHRIDDEQRAALHVAAVFVNNFTNHLYGIGEELTQKEGVPFELLFPLIREGVDRLGSAPARQLQTGPAMRGDQQTQARHLQFLKRYPSYQKIYRLHSAAIHIQAIRHDPPDPEEKG